MRPSLPVEILDAEIVVEQESEAQRRPFRVTVAEPGWRMFMISHFHYDPVWWNTQAAYTETWGRRSRTRSPFQEPGLALVKSHLDMARRDPDYKFVLAELDYLKPYWDAYPEDREHIRRLLADGRLEFVGGTYNEPNTNLTSAESTIRNAIYGIGYQRDVLGGEPATAWQLDAFGHDPQFPGIMADAGVSSSSWARGPFHEWGPNWVRGPGRLPFAELAAGEIPRMQFPMEFDWIAPSGRSLLTSFQADHYSAGWWMDAAPTLEDAEAEVHRLFTELASVAATPNVLLPVGTDYSPPNKWVTSDPPGLEQALPLAKVRLRDPARVLRSGPRGAGEDRPAVLAADAGHEPDLHRQGRLVHRHQAGPADRREHAPRGGEVRHDRRPAGRPFPDRGRRQSLAPAAVRRPPRRDHRVRIGPGLPRPVGRLARGRRARPKRPRRRARIPWRRDRHDRRGHGRSRSSTPCRGRGPTSPASRSS